MKITRSAVLFGIGIAGITAETVYSLNYRVAPDPTLVLLFGAMLGLPAFLNQDLKGNNERRGKNGKHQEADDDDPDTSARPRSINSPKG